MVQVSAQNYIRDPKLQQELGLKVLTSGELRSLQMVLLEIYQEIHRICEKYSLTVLLGGGSALGAVRHKGFIPWDDDMDLMMMRDEYDRFVEAFRKEADTRFRLRKNGLSLHIIKEGTKYQGIFDSSQDDVGVYIDVFPIDYAPENKISRFLRGCCSDFLLFTMNSRNIYLSRSVLLEKMFSANIKTRSCFRMRELLGYLVSGIKQETFLRIHRKIVVCSHDSKLVTIPSGRKHYFGELLDYSVFYPASKALFEKRPCLLPGKVEVYLSNLYGMDYMNLPPEEKRETHPCSSFSITDNGDEK